MTIMPLDKLPFKTDASLYRSLHTYTQTDRHVCIHTHSLSHTHTHRSFGGFLNHSATGNTTPEHIVAKGAPMVAFVANTDIKPGDQITFDYNGRLHKVAELRLSHVCMCGIMYHA